MGAIGPTGRAKGLARLLVFPRLATPVMHPAQHRFFGNGPATIVDRGFWRSLVPKPFRRENRTRLKGKKHKDWKPATFFVVMFLFIGSMSIQMIALRNQSERYVRQTTVRMGQLREALRKLRDGEDLDVSKLLGDQPNENTGEADWEGLMKAIEEDDTLQTGERESIGLKQTVQSAPSSGALGSTPARSLTQEKLDESISDVEASATGGKSSKWGNFF